MVSSKSKKILLGLFIILIGIAAGVILALAYNIQSWEWVKPYGFLLLAAWLYVAVRRLRKIITKNIEDM